jgi:hypothetical protein
MFCDSWRIRGSIMPLCPLLHPCSGSLSPTYELHGRIDVPGGPELSEQERLLLP